jgi:DNA-directed RNA polymerase subunit omega
VDNRFTLVHVAAQRVRQVREGADLMVKASKNSDVVSVLREIAAGRIVRKKKTDSEAE